MVSQQGLCKRILVVEDDPSIAQLCSILLTDSGYAVEVAADGLAGQKLIEGTQFDLYLFDDKMPGMTGSELFRWLQTERPQLANKVVFMTGNLFGVGDGGVIGAGRPVIKKPFTPMQLISSVQNALGSTTG